MLSFLLKRKSPVPLSTKEAVEIKMQAAAAASTSKNDAACERKRYSFDYMIKRGGFGFVFACTTTDSNEEVVAKLSNPKTTLDEFHTEVAMLRLYQHPNIVQFKDAFVCDELWLVLEMMDGGDLRTLNIIGGWEERYVAHAMKQVLQALAFLHHNHVVHRDIKLDNILWNTRGEIKLADFGLMTVLTKECPKPDLIVGTPGYRAPEMLERRGYSTEADLWSLGVCAMELAQGRQQIWDEYMDMQVDVDAHYPNFLGQSSHRFQQFAKKILAKDPRHRPPASVLQEHKFIKRTACTRDDFVLYAMHIRHQIETQNS